MEGGERERERKEFFGISLEDYMRQCDRRYGTANPDLMDVPLWHAIIRHGYPWRLAQAAYRSRGGSESNAPAWRFERFGMSSTRLADGRTIFVGGEALEDYDFCIFNDVIVREADGSHKIYGYPKYDFPPTDFHTATYVEGLQLRSCSDNVVIIGGRGYREDRTPGITNVFALQVGNYVGIDYIILPVETHGDNPGWIWHHQAILSSDGRSIIVFAGQALDANEKRIPMDDVYRLDLCTLIWDRVGHLPAKELLKPIEV